MIAESSLVRIRRSTFAALILVLAGAATCLGQLEIATDPTIISVISQGPIIDHVHGTPMPFSNPYGLAIDQQGNILIASASTSMVWEWFPAVNRFRRVAGQAQFGFAGDGGPAYDSEVNSPRDVAVDPAGNIYIADAQNMRIRMVDANGVITTVAGGAEIGNGFNGDNKAATSLLLCGPGRIATSFDGTLYISESCNNIIRKLVGGVLKTVAGTPPAARFLEVFDRPHNAAYDGDGGPATKAHLNSPAGIALDAAGNLYIADAGNNVVRKVAASTGIITTIAGNGTEGDGGDGGPARNASLSLDGIAVDQAGNLFLAGSRRVREIDVQTGYISTVAGTNTRGYNGDYISAASAELSLPMDVAVDKSGNLFIADNNNLRIRKVLFQVVGFGSEKIGSHSAKKTIKVVNTGAAPIQIDGVGISGPNAADFSMVNSCGAVLASHQTCMVGLTFVPSHVGERKSSLVITNGAEPVRKSVGLIGLGVP